MAWLKTRKFDPTNADIKENREILEPANKSAFTVLLTVPEGYDT